MNQLTLLDLPTQAPAAMQQTESDDHLTLDKALSARNRTAQSGNAILTDLSSKQDLNYQNKDQQKLGNVTEIILPPAMADNIQVLLPMLTLLNSDKRWLAWIDPPAALLSRWRNQTQIVNTEIMVLRSSRSTSAFELARQALMAGTCHAVVTWTKALSSTELCQLEIASHQGDSHGVILRLR